MLRKMLKEGKVRKKLSGKLMKKASEEISGLIKSHGGNFTEKIKDRPVLSALKKAGSKIEAINEREFSTRFTEDLARAKKEVLMYVPWVTDYGTPYLIEAFRKTVKRGVKLSLTMRKWKGEPKSLRELLDAGVKLFERPQIHDKVAIFDGETTYIGSLNFMSRMDSRDTMARIESSEFAEAELEKLKSFVDEKVTKKRVKEIRKKERMKKR